MIFLKNKFYILLPLIVMFLYSFVKLNSGTQPPKIPYSAAGLNKGQAAAHLLSRFSFGAGPGQVEAVAAAGPERWWMQQLQQPNKVDSISKILLSYQGLHMSNSEIIKNYPKPGQLIRRAVEEGFIDKDSVSQDKPAYRQQLKAYMLQKGLKSPQELYRQLVNQKILRAVYSENQLQEVMTDFWFNHFNVSLTKNTCAQFIPNYERDVIRPHVLGKFEDLLLATAHSPAMLLYLDNFSSSGVKENNNRNSSMPKPAARRAGGLNENYARELMELHTMGVDGGYTQQDVTEAARVLTGWTIFPQNENGAMNAIRNQYEKAGEDKRRKQGFVRKGDFLFAANRHDSNPKTVLGKQFPANGGYEEGVTLIKMLAHHPATATFIARKLAVRFVSDQPPQSLVDKMASSFLQSQGDIKQVLTVMISSPEFWSKEALREKTKSPFELAISAVRSLNASVNQPYQLYTWISKMGQQLYAYQAPTGFPDKGQYWINTGALLNRMNFGLALAAQRIPGIRVNLPALNNYHEPESAEDALDTYSRMMMPERDLGETIKRLSPLLKDPDLSGKVDKAAGKNFNGFNDSLTNADADFPKEAEKQAPPNMNNQAMVAQTVGIIIGSPEFQRR